MADSPLVIKGLAALDRGLVQLGRQFSDVAARALNVVAEETMTEAKRRTPVDTGTLRRSGKVHKRATARSLTAEMSFGTEYGVFVHERTDVRHPTGEAKFLENAIKFTAGFFEERVANLIREELPKRDTRYQPGTGAGSPGGTGTL